MKDKWDQKLCIWQRKHSGSRIPKKQFSLLLGETWKELSHAVISSGFRKAGIYPFKRSVVPKEKFDNQALERWEALKKNQNQQTNQVDQEIRKNELHNENAGNMDQHGTEGDAIPGTSKQYSLTFENILLATVKNNRSETSTSTTKKRIAEGAKVITSLDKQQTQKNNLKKQQPKKSKEKVKRTKHTSKK